jgi:hypothetical protein
VDTLNEKKSKPGCRSTGTPFAKRLAKLRTSILGAVNEEDLRLMTEKLVSQAKSGHLPSIKVLLGYVLGKAGGAPDPDRLELDAATIAADRRDVERRLMPSVFDDMLDGLG